MLLWMLFALMTAAVLAAVLSPLMRPAPASPALPGESGSLAVYRDQLSEIELELSRGLIDPAEAEAARLEVSRRLLATADASAGTPAGASDRSGRIVRSSAHALALAVPILALAVYLVYGTPGMPGMPHTEVMEAVARQQKIATDQVSALIAKVEARLREAPRDGKGWDVIAPVYFRVGRFQDAANAYQQALELLGESPQRLNGLADASVFASDGIVTEVARKAYARVLELDPKRIEARFWLALAKEQDGDLAAARSAYDELLAEAPADAPWRSTVEERMHSIATRLDGKGPTQEQVDAAQNADPAQRQQMIEGMVANLADRLKQNAKDLAGWLRLVRAYSVLNRPEEARTALADARKAFAGDEKALGELTQLATTLGLGS